MKRRVTEKDEWWYDSETDEELEQLESKIEFMLDEYDVEYPSEEKVQATIQAIRPFVPMKEKNGVHFYHKVSVILKHSVKEALYISPLFWIVNGIFLLLAFLLVFTDGTSPYLTVMLLAPIPTITGLLEVTKSANAGMTELELSFKYSLQEIILSRMVVIGIFNLAVNGLFTIIVSFIQPDIWIWKLILYWVTPFTVVTALSFIVVSRFRRNYGITVSLALWIGLGVVLNESRIFANLESFPVWGCLLLIAIAVVTAIIQILRIYKRGVSYEFSN